MVQNPFTPGFGQHPPVLAGRGHLLRYLADAYNPRVQHHPFTRTYFRADRGLGKTVLLDAAHDLAVERGWLVVEENGGMVTPVGERIMQRLQRSHSTGPDQTGRTSVGLKAVGLSVERSWDKANKPAPTNMRDTIADILDTNPGITGILVTIDEIHDAPNSEIKQFANEFQHLQRDGYRVAFAGAGLPIGDLSDPAQVPTFLGRSEIPDLGHVHDHEISDALESSLAGTGHSFTTPGLNSATDAAAGLPYALQLIGWHLFDNTPGTTFDRSDVIAVLPAVHQRLLSGLRFPMNISPGRMAFLEAMAHDDGPSQIADVGRRLDRTAQQLSPVRAWLINHGYITAVEHGEIQFAHQGIRAILRTHPNAGERDPLYLSRSQGPTQLEAVHHALEQPAGTPDDAVNAILGEWDSRRTNPTIDQDISGPDLTI